MGVTGFLTGFQNGNAIPAVPRPFKYQEPDTALTVRVVNAVAPGGAESFIRDELLKPMGSGNYAWGNAVSGLLESAAGSAMPSRDMVKFGQLIIGSFKHWKISVR